MRTPTGPGQRTDEGVLRAAWRALRRDLTGSRVETFPYSAPREGVLGPEEIRSGCNICFNSCTTRVYRRDGKAVTMTGNPDDPVTGGHLCPKSQFLMQMYSSEHRLLFPQRRRGRRGEGRFERVSWDEALDELAARLSLVRDRDGPEALAVFTGSRSGLLALDGAAELFCQLWGTPNHSGTNPFCGTGPDLAFQMTQGVEAGGSGNIFAEDDLWAADLYLFVGDNMAETRPVNFGQLNDRRLRRGARLLVIDPRETATAQKADEWIPIRPGTDLALALAWLHHLFARELVDREFLASWVEGHEAVREFVLARGYSPEWAEPITEIPAATIRRLGEEYARTPRAVIFANRGLSQHSNSLQTFRALLMVAAATGHWGRKAAGVMAITSDLPIKAEAPPERRPATRPRIRRSPAGWIEAMRSGRPYPIKALIMTGNPLSLWPDQAALREGLASLDAIAHIELFPSESSAWADYLLPAATGIEVGEINRYAEDRRIVWIEKVIDPPGEARPDYWIWIELGKRLGFADVLKEEHKDPVRLWDEAMRRDPRMRGLSAARLRASPTGWLRWPILTEDGPGAETLFLPGSVYPGDPAGRRFPTPSGKLELWTPALEETFRRYGLSALPEFYTEPEQLLPLPTIEYVAGDGEEGVLSPVWETPCLAGVVRIVAEPPAVDRQRYDMELITGRPPTPHFHSWTHWLWQAQEQCADLFAHLHPDRAAALGIRTGDRVRIESPRGAIEAVAWVAPGIRPSAVYVPLGWDERQPYHPWRPVNWLMPREPRCPVSDQANFKMSLCRVSRV
ncbi:MAG: molybdopterin-dependent oxidoreductase [Candidatus Rokubacteria bacterium]|nr:molybdopterin-dependent oxidoreductase [Candidatus Rokubacteria bacterium]